MFGAHSPPAQQWETLLVHTLQRQKLVEVIWPNDSPLPAQTFPLLGACGPRDMVRACVLAVLGRFV